MIRTLSYIVAVLLCFGAATAAAQSFHVEPYLQLVEPESAWVLWETDTEAASLVEYGLTASLGQSAEGTRDDVPGGGWVHEVELAELEPYTRYYYRVTSGAAVSETTHFVTAPSVGSETSFRFVAMSDMQNDSSNPTIFNELVTDGILAFFEDRYDEDLTDALALTLIPGDLVENGTQRGDWHDQFWPAIAPLAAQIPTYAVPGNHEQNAAAFFEYFHQPDNGTEGVDEHWWWKDYSNVRIIGLDSNSIYASPVQLAWLDGVLDETCASEHVDFVFAQLHHPHLSELWLPGESNFTGDVIARLEQFSVDCGKPSAHLFGHTHGYSRGQSRDHDHLWINVASAGGRIDRWGEYPQNDYDEFSVSRDEFGFVVFDVQAGSDPSFRLERINRGLPEAPVDNEVVDVIEIRRYNEAPDRPVIAGPEGDANPDCSVMVASEFVDVDGDLFGASNWQIAASCDDFEEPLFDSWEQFENVYEGEDRQAGDDLTDEEFLSLPPQANLCARVRYRDRSLAWSEWSEPAAFQTGESQPQENLLVNPGAEDNLTGWTISAGVVESLPAFECDGVEPYSGERYFVAGGLCESSEYGEAFQRVELGTDLEGLTLQYGASMSDFGGNDVPAVWLEFVGADGVILSETDRLERPRVAWAVEQNTALVPVGAVAVNYVFSGTRFAGEDNDSYLDDLWIRRAPACSVAERPDPGETGEDAGPEPEPDAGTDAGDVDGGADAGSDAGSDADLPDTTPDAEEDVTADADADTDLDTAVDVAVDSELPEDSNPDTAVEVDSVPEDAGTGGEETGSDGGCSAAMAASGAWHLHLLLLGFGFAGAWRRRREQPASVRQ